MITIDVMRSLLGRSAADPSVIALTKTAHAHITRHAHLGLVELLPEGISVMFKEAAWVVAAPGDPRELRVCAFHLHVKATNVMAAIKEPCRAACCLVIGSKW